MFLSDIRSESYVQYFCCDMIFDDCMTHILSELILVRPRGQTYHPSGHIQRRGNVASASMHCYGVISMPMRC